MTTGADGRENRQLLSKTLTPRHSVVTLRRWLFGGFVGLMASTGVAGITWYAVTSSGGMDRTGPAPLIKAQVTPVKVRPKTPGGMDVPNRDKQVYSRISGNPAPSKPVRLQAPPELPVARPAASVAAKAPTPAASAKATDALTVANAAPDPSLAQPEQLLPPPPRPKPIAKATPAPTPAPTPALKTAKVEPAPSSPNGNSGEKLDIAAAAKRVAAVTPAAGGYRIQFLASKSQARTKLARTRMLKAHGKLFSGLAVTVDRADLGAKGVFYRLRAGPFAGRAQAETMCARFKARKVGCIIVKP